MPRARRMGARALRVNYMVFRIKSVPFLPDTLPLVEAIVTRPLFPFHFYRPALLLKTGLLKCDG
jgi:hypothetical protein